MIKPSIKIEESVLAFSTLYEQIPCKSVEDIKNTKELVDKLILEKISKVFRGPPEEILNKIVVSTDYLKITSKFVHVDINLTGPIEIISHIS